MQPMLIFGFVILAGLFVVALCVPMRVLAERRQQSAQARQRRATAARHWPRAFEPPARPGWSGMAGGR